MPDDENKGISEGEGADISGMFKGLGKKPPREIRFERPYPETPKIVQWAIKFSRGLIKTEKQAQYALLGFVILVIIISLILMFSGGGPELPSQQEIFRDTPPTAQ